MRKELKRGLVIGLGLLSSLLFFLPMANGEVEIQGFADSYRAVRMESPNDYLGSRTRIRLETRFSEEEAGAFVSFNAVQNDIVTAENGINLLESYLEYAGEFWDIRAGRQIIIWGKGDGLQVTDIVSPRDYSEFLARDFDDTRLAVEAMKIRLLGESTDLELIWIPVFKEAIMPTDESPWYLSSGSEDATSDITYNETIKPEKNLQNSEIGIKLSFYLSGFDIAFSLFNTWSDLPTMHRMTTGSGTVISPEYHRLTFGAVEFSLPLGDVVIRGEGARFHGGYFETIDTSGDPFIMKDYSEALLGLDWSPGSNWSISTQAKWTVIQDYEERLVVKEQREVVSLSISKSLFREKLELACMAYADPDIEDSFSRISFDYALTDELHLSGGVDVFDGDAAGNYGRYDDNDEVWFKMKYSF